MNQQLEFVDRGQYYLPGKRTDAPELAEGVTELIGNEIRLLRGQFVWLMDQGSEKVFASIAFDRDGQAVMQMDHSEVERITEGTTFVIGRELKDLPASDPIDGVRRVSRPATKADIAVHVEFHTNPHEHVHITVVSPFGVHALVQAT